MVTAIPVSEGPPGSWISVASAWSGCPMLVVAVLLGVAYAVGVRRVRRRGLPWRVARSLAWSAGLTLLLAVTVTAVGALARSVLWVFTAQVLVLLLVVPVLLAYGRPVVLWRDAGGFERPLRSGRWSRGLAVFSSPLLGPVLVPVALGVLYFSPALRLVLARAWVAAAVQLLLLALGGLIAMGLVGSGAEQEGSLALGAAVALGLVELLSDAIPGIALRLQTHLVTAPDWVGRHRSWGPRPLDDQRTAGALLWFVAEATDLPYLVILVRRFLRADEREAVAADHALDLAGPVDHSSTGVTVPWWETDTGRLAGHRLGRRAQDADSPRPGISQERQAE